MGECLNRAVGGLIYVLVSLMSVGLLPLISVMPRVVSSYLVFKVLSTVSIRLAAVQENY